MEARVELGQARIVVKGRRAAEVHVLEGQTLTVGRSPECGIILTDPRCSRSHLRIEPVGEGYRAVDLGSQNGTILNGRRVREALLRPGDVLLVGGTRLIFEADAVLGGTRDQTVVALPSPPKESPADIPLVERLRRLAEVTRRLNSETSSLELLRLIIDASVSLTGSERGFLLECRKEGMHFAAARNIDREDLDTPEFELSWSIAIQVGTKGEAVLAVNAAEDDRFRSLESVEALGLRSVLSVPVTGPSGILGVIYVDNRVHLGAYQESDLEILEVLADQAGIALTNRQLMEELTRRNEEVVSLNERLRARLEEQENEIARMRGRFGDGDEDPFLNYRALVGGSARMDELRHLLQKVAATDFPVLIQGGSGTGKELVARCIHRNSARAAEAFVSLNCAAIPESLLENELFGHARGAYTGADRARKGLFEAAHGGTLFLDEVSEMSPAMQTRLLRVLQEGELRPVGGKGPIQVDVRIIAASNRDLGKLIHEGGFREDLYYRLRVLPVEVPGLRERREDIPELVRHLFGKHAAGSIPAIDPEAMDVLCSYTWPGNVRELENEIKRLIALAGPMVNRAALSRHIAEAGEMLVGSESSFHDLSELVESIETREIRKALQRCDGNKTHAASLLGISRFTLQRKLDKYALTLEDD